MEPILQKTLKKVRYLRKAIEAYQTAILAKDEYSDSTEGILEYMILLRKLGVNLGLCSYFEHLDRELGSYYTNPFELAWIWKYKIPNPGASFGWIYPSPGSVKYEPGYQNQIIQRLTFRLEVLKWELGLTLAEEELNKDQTLINTNQDETI